MSSVRTGNIPSMGLALTVQRLVCIRKGMPLDIGFVGSIPRRKCCHLCGEYFRIIDRLSSGRAP
jgi:hypothetical protein